MKISYSKDFIKATKSLNVAQKSRLKQRIGLFLDDPRNSQLRNHKLSGEWSGYSSINISGDLRAVLRKAKTRFTLLRLARMQGYTNRIIKKPNKFEILYFLF